LQANDVLVFIGVESRYFTAQSSGQFPIGQARRVGQNGSTGGRNRLQTGPARVWYRSGTACRTWPPDRLKHSV